MNISIGDISSIEPKQGLARASGPDRSLTAQDLRRSIPGNGHSANNKFDLHASSGTGRTPSCEYAKPRKPARKNTGHEMCDLAKERTQATRVVERTDFLDDLGDRVIRKIKPELRQCLSTAFDSWRFAK